MEKSSRFPNADSHGRRIDLSAKPVLAQLPDVSADVERQRVVTKPGAGGVDYRFDPPQQRSRVTAGPPTQNLASSLPLKSELVFAPRAARPHTPHLYERTRSSTLNQTAAARRESPILPRANPFALPRRRLIDSIPPFIQFVTLVALFTAAGTWIQMAGIQPKPQPDPVKPPVTTVQDPIPPAAKTAERPGAAPTSAGPARTTPEAKTHIGHASLDHNFATLRGDVLPFESRQHAEGPAGSEFSRVGDENLPHVQTTELPETETLTAADQDIHSPAAVARRLPGVGNEIPPR